MGSPVRDQTETVNLIQDLIIILIRLRMNNPLTYGLEHKRIIPLPNYKFCHSLGYKDVMKCWMLSLTPDVMSSHIIFIVLTLLVTVY